MPKKKNRQKSEQLTSLNNDNLSKYLEDFFPKELEGNDKFLDLEEEYFARVKIPHILPRFVKFPCDLRSPEQQDVV